MKWSSILKIKKCWMWRSIGGSGSERTIHDCLLTSVHVYGTFFRTSFAQQVFKSIRSCNTMSGVGAMMIVIVNTHECVVQCVRRHCTIVSILLSLCTCEPLFSVSNWKKRSSLFTLAWPVLAFFFIWPHKSTGTPPSSRRSYQGDHTF